MARIRTIKPEFWTDTDMVRLPFEARLLYIGLWNFVDDAGYILDEPDRVKMLVFPGDPVDAEGLIDLLVAAGKVERVSDVEGERWLSLPRFIEHQKIQHPGRSIASERGVIRRVKVADGARRALARRAGCAPGQSGVPVECHRCGTPGSVQWSKRTNGQPSAWVAFSGVELDRTANGEDVLSCRECLSSPHETPPTSSRALMSPPEDSGALMLYKEREMERERERDTSLLTETPAPAVAEEVRQGEGSEGTSAPEPEPAVQPVAEKPERGVVPRMVQVWNDNRRSSPRLVMPVSPTRAKMLKATHSLILAKLSAQSRAPDEALDVWRRSVQAFVGNDFHAEKRSEIDTLARDQHRDKWVTAGLEELPSAANGHGPYDPYQDDAWHEQSDRLFGEERERWLASGGRTA